jgi:hypothetical protein
MGEFERQLRVGSGHSFTWVLTTFRIDEQHVEAQREGLWFVGGSFANCRTYSYYVAVQIKAIEERLLLKR